MKNFLVIGNPINHSLSPKLHNYWIKKNNINAIYKKKKLEENDLENLIFQVKEKKIDGINVTVPFKKTIIPFSNVIDLENSPSYPTDKGLNAFFDLGSWMGFSLSDDKTTTGFSGPYILGVEHGIWASNNFTSLDLVCNQSLFKLIPCLVTYQCPLKFPSGFAFGII